MSLTSATKEARFISPFMGFWGNVNSTARKVWPGFWWYIQLDSLWDKYFWINGDPMMVRYLEHATAINYFMFFV